LLGVSSIQAFDIVWNILIQDSLLVYQSVPLSLFNILSDAYL